MAEMSQEPLMQLSDRLSPNIGACQRRFSNHIQRNPPNAKHIANLDPTRDRRRRSLHHMPPPPAVLQQLGNGRPTPGQLSSTATSASWSPICHFRSMQRVNSRRISVHCPRRHTTFMIDDGEKVTKTPVRLRPEDLADGRQLSAKTDDEYFVQDVVTEAPLDGNKEFFIRHAAGMASTVGKWRVPLLGAVRTENVLLLATLFSVIIGTVVGLVLNKSLNPNMGDYLSERRLVYLRFPGEMFLRMLTMLIVPLVVASNISAIASLNAKAARFLTGMSFLYYITTTAMAICLGLVMAWLIEPGVHRFPKQLNGTLAIKGFKRDVNALDSVMDLVRNMIPINLLKAGFAKTLTSASKINKTVIQYAENGSFAVVKQVEVIRIDNDVSGSNILGLITFSIMFGFAVHSLGPDAAVLGDMFHATRRVVIYLVSIVIWFSPIGIMSLIAAELAKTEDLPGSLENLSLYVATVMAALIIHGCIVLPTLLFVFTGRNPIKYAYNMMQALMCALGTASSTATLPCTIRCLEKGNQIDPRVTRLMLPLGTTVNMDGTALFQAVAVVYIAQLEDQQLSLGEMILIGITSLLASMAATSMPSAGLITISMVLSAVGISTERIVSLVPVDWFLDRFRTTVNVFGNSVGAAIVSHVCEYKLMQPADDEDDEVDEESNHGDVEMMRYPGGLTAVDYPSTFEIDNSHNDHRCSSTDWNTREYLRQSSIPQRRSNGHANGHLYTQRHQNNHPRMPTVDCQSELSKVSCVNEEAEEDYDSHHAPPRICIVNEDTVYVEI